MNITKWKILWIMLLMTVLFVDLLGAVTAPEGSGNDWILSELPRYGMDGQPVDSNFDKDTIDELTAGDYQHPYLQGIAFLFILPMIIPIWSLIICPFWCCCRCCGCCCCKKSGTAPPNAGGFVHYWLPLLFLFATSIVITVFVGLGYTGNTGISNVLLHRNKGDFEAGMDSNLFDITLGVFHSAKGLVGDISGRIGSNLPRFVNEAADGVLDILNRIDDITNVTMRLSQGHRELGATWDQFNVTGNVTLAQSLAIRDNDISAAEQSKSFQPLFAKTIKEQADAAADQIEAGLDSAMGPINDQKGEIETTIVEGANETIKMIDDAVVMLNDVIEMIDGFEDTVDEQRPGISEKNDMRELAMNIFYGLPALPIFLLLIGAIFKLPILFTISYSCFWLIAVLMMLPLIVILPIGSLMSDMCDFMDAIDDDVSATYNETFAQIFDSCMSGAKLTDALDVGADLDEIKGMEFDKFSNLSDNIDASELTALTEQVKDTKFKSFEDDAIEGLNRLIYSNNTCYRLMTKDWTPYPTTGLAECQNANCSVAGCGDLGRYNEKWNRTSNPPVNSATLDAIIQCHYYYKPTSEQWSIMVQLVEGLTMEYSAKKDAAVVRDGIADDLDGLMDIVHEAKNITDSAEYEINNAHTLLVPVFDEVEFIMNMATCAFIGDRYREFHHVLCVDVVSHLADAATAMAVIGVMCLVSCCGTVKMVRKAGAARNSKGNANSDREVDGAAPVVDRKKSFSPIENRRGTAFSYKAEIGDMEMEPITPPDNQLPPDNQSLLMAPSASDNDMASSSAESMELAYGGPAASPRLVLATPDGDGPGPTPSAPPADLESAFLGVHEEGAEGDSLDEMKEGDTSGAQSDFSDE